VPSIIWKRLDREGHEFCSLEGTRLRGVAVIEHEGSPCQLGYEVESDATWRTRWTRVRGVVGDGGIDVSITADEHGTWRLDGEEIEAVAGCIDVDLNFSPSTNTLPIRRVQLAVGEEAEVRAAWLRFPSFRLEPLVQRYRRLDEHTYHYESGSFAAEVRVNDAGLVTTYESFCETIAETI
jgi:uncharacterized protein